MGMVVRTNTMALNAYRQLGMNNAAVTKSLEKLSSGFRINRAGDDAAGLAISEKMKAQITGLETASANAQDGISLIQTAEGNLNEVHSMLNRMVELATKSANGTYTSTERRALQDEVDQLLDEIDRISKSANFNGTKLLNGTMGLNNEALTIGQSTDYVAAGDKAMEVTATHASAAGSEVKPEFTVDFKDFAWTSEVVTGKTVTANAELTIGGKAIKVYDGAGAQTFGDYSVDGTTSTAGAAGKIAGTDIATDMNNKYFQIDGNTYKATTNGSEVTFTFQGKSVEGTANGFDPADTKVPNNTWSPTGDLSVSVTAKDEDDNDVTGAIDAGKRQDCPVFNIKDPAAGGDPVRAGAKVTLTAEMIKVGNQLKIGDTVFTFVAGDDPATVTGNTNGANANIVVDSKLSAEDQLKSVTRQLSFMTASIKDGTGTAKVFNIGRSNDSTLGGIEIEENDTTAANWGKFTEAQLKAAFKLGTQETMANTTLTIVDNDKLADKEKILVDGTEYEFAKGKDLTETMSNIQTALGSKYTVTTATDAEGKGVVTIAAKASDKGAPVLAGSGLTLQIGDTAEPFNKMTVKVADMSSKGLGLEHLKTVGIMNEVSASDAIDKVKNAINTVSSTRAGMGALQNRLEHTINNLDVAVENLSAANSRIRDTDMAKEMMNYTKMNVLVQSAQAMLAQANQQPQSVLQLLQ